MTNLFRKWRDGDGRPGRRCRHHDPLRQVMMPGAGTEQFLGADRRVGLLLVPASGPLVVLLSEVLTLRAAGEPVVLVTRPGDGSSG